jgi:AcrR family transcriptional regulator
LSPRAKTSGSVRERRTHAERTAQTRERVMSAVVETISEVGFKRATAAEISRRAGVTWGAVQHHFGDKDGILMAVLEKSFDHFAQILGDVSPDEDLEKRVALFVERSWSHFSSPHYRSTFEILLNLPDETELHWQNEMLGAWRRIWFRYFHESPVRANGLPNKQTIELMLYTVSVLTGLASTQLLEGNPERPRSGELGYLKNTLVSELQRHSFIRPSGQ